MAAQLSGTKGFAARLEAAWIARAQKRRIATGEELAVDYKYAADLPPMACRCLAPDCRGTMNRLNLPRPKSLTATGRVSDTG
jgi:hypothetical protein